MADVETLAERIQTVERAVTDGTSEFPEATTLADIETRIESLETTVEEIDERTAELEAATQALRGYVGNIRSVNDDVEQRADAALAATERLERELTSQQSETIESGRPRTPNRNHQRPVQSPNQPDQSLSTQSSSGSNSRPSTDRTTNSGTEQRASELDTLADDIETSERAESQTDSDEPGLFASIRERL